MQAVSLVPAYVQLLYCGQEVRNPDRRPAVGRPRQGDVVNFAFQRGKIVMTPKLVIDGSRFPAADDEYTQTQRRIIDPGLARTDADIKAGLVSKAFSDHAEFIAALHREAAKPCAKKTSRQAKGGPKSKMTKRTQLGGVRPSSGSLPNGPLPATRVACGESGPRIGD